MRIVLATHNRDKVREIRHIMEGLDVELLTVDDFEGIPQPVEDGESLEANALKKAREIRDYTGASALADDTGLEVDALDGAPGIHAARYAGDDQSYERNCAKLIANLEGVPAGERGARFRTVMALALNPDDERRLAEFLDAHPEERPVEGGAVDALVAEGIFPGEITTEPRGENGFGYDPVFFDPERGRTLAEMTAQEKNQISHRYRALVEMRELLLRMELVRET